MNNNDANELRKQFKLARACATRAFPYWEEVMVGMGYAIDPAVTTPFGSPTMGVTEKAQLLIHPDFMGEVLEKGGGIRALGFIVAHESLHIILRHPHRMRLLQEKHGPRFDAKISAIAVDAATNGSLRRAAQSQRQGVLGIVEPTGDMAPIYPENFELPPNGTYEQYYDLLMRQAPPQKPQGGEGEGEPKSGGGEGAESDPKPTQGNKHCDDQFSEQAMKVAEKVRGMSEQRQERVARGAAEKAKQAAERNRGSVPEGLLLDIEEAVKPPKVDWRDILRAVVSSALEHRSGSDYGTFTRMNRRQGMLGFGAGSVRMPGHYEVRPAIVVVQDTSGSMGGDLLDSAAEIMGIIEATGGEIHMIGCDTVATDVGKVVTLSEVARGFVGGGGTDMNSALDMAVKHSPDLVVCVTDGYIGSPGSFRGYQMIWCLTKHGNEQDVAQSVSEGWATVVRMDDD